jgi:hypothetical protein
LKPGGTGNEGGDEEARTHKCLEWFNLPDHKTLHPLCIALGSRGVQNLRKIMRV